MIKFGLHTRRADPSDREVLVLNGPLDGCIVYADPADTSSGYPDEVRVAGHGGHYRMTGEWATVEFSPGQLQPPQVQPMPTYVWEGEG
jgi:hypothetical protein